MSTWIAACRLVPDPTLSRPAPGIVLGGTPARVLRITRKGDLLLDEILAISHAVDLTTGGSRLLQRMIEAGMLHPEPESDVGGTVSVVIPAYNHGAYVVQAIRASADWGPVVVVDDASVDDTGMRAIGAGATVIEVRTNVGPAAARNRGAAETNGEWLVFVDADCVPEPSSLTTLLSHFADPRVGAVAPRIVGFGSDDLVGRYELARSPIDMGRKPGPVRPDARVSFVPTAVLAVRRVAFEAVGGFDEGLRFGEDVDFIWRLAAAGWTVRYESRAIARHHHRRQALEIARRRWLYGTSAGPLAQRHPGGLAAVRASPWTLGAWLALVLGRPWLATGMIGWSWLGLYRALRALPHPHRMSARLVLRGFFGASRPLASALTRYWAPITMAAAILSKQLRRRLLALIAIGMISEWIEREPKVDPVRFAALAVIDDVLFCGGVWQGCLHSRVIGPLLPRTGRPKIGSPG